MLVLQGSILDLRGPFQAQEGPSKAWKESFENKGGEKQLVFLWGDWTRGAFNGLCHPCRRSSGCAVGFRGGTTIYTATYIPPLNNTRYQLTFPLSGRKKYWRKVSSQDIYLRFPRMCSKLAARLYKTAAKIWLWIIYFKLPLDYFRSRGPLRYTLPFLPIPTARVRSWIAAWSIEHGTSMSPSSAITVTWTAFIHWVALRVVTVLVLPVKRAPTSRSVARIGGGVFPEPQNIAHHKLKLKVGGSQFSLPLRSRQRGSVLRGVMSARHDGFKSAPRIQFELGTPDTKLEIRGKWKYGLGSHATEMLTFRTRNVWHDWLVLLKIPTRPEASCRSVACELHGWLSPVLDFWPFAGPARDREILSSCKAISFPECFIMHNAY